MEGILESTPEMDEGNPVLNQQESEAQKAKEIVMDFVHLLEKAKNLFNGLKEIPQYGAKLWQPYFARTFEVYTRLWKYQQEHRKTLETYYKLKRWQIGEIASKIGQIHYHYYLRTSEPNYLYEAFSFYAAIRTRAYYAKAKKHDTPEVMLKKLRYYTRFIVVCLLLRRMTLVVELVKELNKQIKDYKNTYESKDREWLLVANEVSLFVDNEQLLRVKDQFNRAMYLNSRISLETVIPLDKTVPRYLDLYEVVIVGHNGAQIKFSELTLDMFRMLQAVEYEPQEDLLQERQTDASMILSSPRPVQPNLKHAQTDDQPIKRHNPHKYLLYKPTYAQLQTYISVAFKELPPQSALLLYFSCEPSYPSNKKDLEEACYDMGGLGLNCGGKDEDSAPVRKRIGGHDMHCFFPGDIIPYTRKPLFLILDSPTASSFKFIPKLFGQPLVALMAAQEVPAAMADQQHQGSLLTLFLFNPTMAFFYVCNLDEVPEELWVKCQTIVFKYMDDCAKLIIRS
ncbi:protein SCAI-like isoform X2 [Watersipora subatra]|uniref:protein SCAI-like isoform X2 n=1 Tax=Watersipora subatra TaxID=2589382 RepID=UPI00355B1D68